MGVNIVRSTMSKNPNTIEVYRGQSKDISLTIKKDDRDIDNNPIEVDFDLTGCTLLFSVRTSPTSPSTILTKISSDPAQISISADPTTGEATIFLEYSETMDLEPKIYYFDVWVMEAGGRRYPVVEPSEFKVLPAVTHF